MRSLNIAVLAILVASIGAAQERHPHRVEIDGLFGYTVVDIEQWAEFPQIDEMSPVAGGVVVRGLLVYLSTMHVGIEVGTQRLFTYRFHQETPTQITTHEATVAGYHVLLVGRVVERERHSWDLGFGWYALGDAAVPGLMTSFRYAVLRRPRFSIPVGARLNIVLNEPAVAATMMGSVGISIPLRREADAGAR